MLRTPFRSERGSFYVRTPVVGNTMPGVSSVRAGKKAGALQRGCIFFHKI